MTTITTRSGKGSPLTNDEVDANFTGLNSDKVETSGDSMTGNLSFGDNDKAIFGAGSDLQIYHDGANSYIQNVTNSLIIQNDSDDKQVIIKSDNGSGGVADYFRANGTTGEALLYHYGSSKLATTATGIDVTGTVTADGLTVNSGSTNTAATFESTDRTVVIPLIDSVGSTQIRSIDGEFAIRTGGDGGSSANTAERMRIDSSGNVGIGTSLPAFGAISTGIEVEGTTAGIRLQGATTGALELYHNNGLSTIDSRTATGGSKIAFNTENTERMRIDASGNVGINTSSPAYPLHIWSDTTIARFGGTDTNDTYLNIFKDNASSIIKIQASKAGAGATDVAISPDGGNVGIGTSSPSFPLEVDGGTGDGIKIKAGNTSNDDSFLVANSSNTTMFLVDGGGNVGIGTDDPKALTHIYTESGINTADTLLKLTNVANTARYVGFQAQRDNASGQGLNVLITKTDASVVNALTINTSANVGIGTSSPATHLHVQGSSGEIRVQDTGSGGGIVSFRDSGTSSIPSIRSSGNNLRVNTGGSERMRIDSSGNLLVGTTNVNPAANNVTGHALKAGGLVEHANSGAMVMRLNRTDSNGSIIELRKGTDVVGEVGTASSRLYIGTDDTGLRFTNDEITPFNPSVSADRNGTVDLGGSSTRFKDLHLSGTAIANSGFQVGTTGIGNIGNSANDVVIYSSTTGHNGLRFHANGILPTNNSGAIIDADADLGISTHRFKDLYLSGSVITGGNTTNNFGSIDFKSDSVRARIIGGYASGGGGYLKFHTDSTGGSDLERMRIDSSGNLLVGRTSRLPGQVESISSDTVVSAHGDLTSHQTSTVVLQYNPANNLGMLRAYGATAGTGQLRFNVGGGGGSTDFEAMRIDSSGNLLVGATTFASAGGGHLLAPSGTRSSSRTVTTAAFHNLFYNANGIVGGISTSGSATTFATSSDQRLKDNIVDAPSASDDIDAIQVRSFDWKADGSHQKYGMVAQELQSVAPESVSEGETEDDMMGVDYSKLVPMLVKEIQSLRARVAQLETN